jgi:hypothetical protein
MVLGDERATDLIQSFAIREPVKRSDRAHRIALLLEPQMDVDEREYKRIF